MCFAVVIPAYNRKATLRQTLAALSAQDYLDYELIVVDDGSTDGTREMMDFKMLADAGSEVRPHTDSSC
jgi:glycosyltransferase involved in cell wall biosynthesis